MKRILIFALAYHPYVGGAEISVKEITDRLNPEEYEFHMVTLRFDCALPKREKRGNITIHRIGAALSSPRISDRDLPLRLRISKTLFPFTAFFKALQLDQTYVFDAVWCVMANQAGFAALFFKFLHPRTPYILDLQDGRSLIDMKKRRAILRPLWFLYKRIYLKADAIKAISRFLEREARLLGYTGAIHVIPNGVDFAKFSGPIPEAKLCELKERFNKKMGDVFLFTASRLVLSRGVEETIRSLLFLPPNVKLLIAGAGDDGVKLERIAHEAGVADRVTFLGHVSHEELPAYYRLADIFVRPSVIEGFGSSFVEAFAAGIPVVATPVGGIPDFLFDASQEITKPTGLFCNVGDPESIARAVRRYMEDPSLVSKVVQNARSLAGERYGWDTIAARMDKVLRLVASPPRLL